ncbi:nucleoid-associated protein YejK [Alteromonas oceanisediminis]|uniref:nucleoid-associated protein YejK n=1 Tax=Alteromonas oceanisediminis TaxID=2836180 RepID=UPI001BDAB65D|nr:nucleoid-associated protein YejK [Alteromonas oceanisediminis]MBT0587197.1 nucleoid-associated protein YejK [Alteromonas oceanisediminis]
MSAVIHQFIVHQLRINKDKAIQLMPKAQCLSVTPSIEALVEQINHAFNAKPGKGVGGFQVDTSPTQEGDFQFEAALNKLLKVEHADDDTNAAFQQFSASSAQHLVETLANMQMVETGFLVFCRYEFLATEYLIVTLLNTKQHVHVDDQLELSVSEHLDLSKMQLAARIDLTQYQIQPEQQRYVSFVKGRMGRKVSDFFMTFLGCEELMDVKQQNAQLINSVDAYLATNTLDVAEKHEHREAVQDYYKEKIATGAPVKFSEVAEKLPKHEDTKFDFNQFVQSAEVTIDEAFQPDKGVLKQLAKFSGQGGGVSLSFDRKLYGDRVRYDEQTDTLVIRGIPPNLKDQLLRSK